MPRCIMLDVDGVLVDGRPEDGNPWTHTLLADIGIDPSVLADKFFANEWAEIVTGRRDLLPALSRCLDQITTTVTAEDLVSYWFEKDSRIVGSVLQDCREAREDGFLVQLATNQEHLRARYLMENMDLKSEVDGIIYSAQVGVQKPHTAFYCYAVDRVQCEPNDIILVDDTKANVKGALNAGWQASHWDGNQRLSEILHRTWAQ